MDANESASFYAQKEIYGVKPADSKQSIGIRRNGISNKLTHHTFLIQSEIGNLATDEGNSLLKMGN